MNRKWKEVKKPTRNSPVLFEDEEIGTSSSDDVNASKSSNATSQSSKPLKGHSTPIRKKIKNDASDSPELVYTESPIESLTQNPPNEVGWDYQRPLSKEEDGKITDSMDISRTPKRNILLSKKRNSNSPLLYKPLKKKLIQEEQKEVTVGFMAELRAIEMKVKEIGEKNIDEPQKTDNDIESQLIVEMDSQPSDSSDIKLQVSANTDESPAQSKTSVANKNYDALMDDSIEDIMVMCSQEVEAKEFGIQSIHSGSSKRSLNSSSEKALTNRSKENVQPANEKIITDTSSKNSSSSKTESGSLEIPDDSLDEYFVGIDEKDFMKSTNNEILIDSVNKSVKSYSKPCTKLMSTTATAVPTAKSFVNQNKFFQSKNCNYTTQTKTATSVSNHRYINQPQTTNVSIQNKIINSKANYGYLTKNFAKESNSFDLSSKTQLSSDNSNDKNNETRLFKAKSFSDSNFLHQSAASNNFGHRSNSNLNVNSMLQPRPQNKNSVFQNTGSSYSSGSSTENKSWRRVQSTSSINNSNVSNNSQQACVHKLSSREGSKLSTPEEIERKKQEAIMKREAKLKMKLDNQSSKRPTQNPAKR